MTTSQDPVTTDLSQIYNPRFETWSDHFSWSDDKLEVIGMTLEGRATVERLKLNREEVINLRRLLQSVGLHPPTGTMP